MVTGTTFCRPPLKKSIRTEQGLEGSSQSANRCRPDPAIFPGFGRCRRRPVRKSSHRRFRLNNPTEPASTKIWKVNSRRQFLQTTLAGISAAAETIHSTPTHGLPVAGFAGKVSPSEETIISGIVSEFLTRNQSPGLSIAFGSGGVLHFAQGYGTAELHRSVPVTPHHRFRIASVSKPITAVAVFQQMQRGTIRASDKVFGVRGILGTRFGKQPYPRWLEEITVDHLLTHTSGGWGPSQDPMFSNPRMNHAELVSWAIEHQPPTHPPGEFYEYSNFGYCLLGRILETCTGLPYSESVQRNLLTPCGIVGMRIAGNTLKDRAEPEVTYHGQNGEDPYSLNVARMDSHGGWIATPTDLVRFVMNLDATLPGQSILSADSVRKMIAGSGVNPGYARGWAVNSKGHCWHNGEIAGTTAILVRTASGLCWSALANTRSPGSSLEVDKLCWKIVSKVKAWEAALA